MKNNKKWQLSIASLPKVIALSGTLALSVMPSKSYAWQGKGDCDFDIGFFDCPDWSWFCDWRCLITEVLNPCMVSAIEKSTGSNFDLHFRDMWIFDCGDITWIGKMIPKFSSSTIPNNPDINNYLQKINPPAQRGATRTGTANSTAFKTKICSNASAAAGTLCTPKPPPTTTTTTR